MADHLGYEKGERPPFPSGNHRNGTSPKTVLTEVGAVGLEVPRDRNGKSEPQIVPKHARRVAGFNTVPQRPASAATAGLPGSDDAGAAMEARRRVLAWG